MMRVYLAGPYGARSKLQFFRDDLTKAGIECTSSWLNETVEINEHTTGAANGLPDDDVDGHARMDISDIERSDVLVLFTGESVQMQQTGNSGGRHVETGYALARGKRIIVVGKPENVFHRLVTVERYPDWKQTQHRLTTLADHAAMPPAVFCEVCGPGYRRGADGCRHSVDPYRPGIPA